MLQLCVKVTLEPVGGHCEQKDGHGKDLKLPKAGRGAVLWPGGSVLGASGVVPLWGPGLTAGCAPY